MAVAKTIKGITIEIGGNVSPLSKSLESINDKSKGIQSQLRAVNELLKFDPTNTDALTRKQTLLAEAVNTAKEKLEFLKSTQAQIEEKFKNKQIDDGAYKAFQNEVTYAEANLRKAEKAISDFTDECEKNNVKLGDVGENLDKAGDEADSFADKSKKSGKEVKEAGENSEKAGKKAKESGDKAREGGNGWEKFGSLAASAGKIAVAGIATVSTATAAAATGTWKLANDAGAAADELITLSNKTGVAVETLQEWEYAARFVDVEVDTLTASMAKQIKSMSTVDNVSAEAAVNLNKLSAAETKAANAALSVEAAQIKYDAAVKKSGEASSAAKQAAISLEKAQNNLAQAQLEVESASQAVEPKINDMTKAYNALGVAVYDENGNMRDSQTVFWELIDALGAVENETQRDAYAMQIFGKSAQDLNPLIKAGGKEMQKLAEEAREAGLVLSKETVADLGAFDDTMQKTQAQIQGLGRQVAVNFLPAVQSVGSAMQDILSDVGTALSDGLQEEDIETVGESISKKLADGMQTVSKYTPSLTKTVSNMISRLLATVLTLLPTLLPSLMSATLSLFQNLLGEIGTLLPQFISTLTQTLNELVSNTDWSSLGTLVSDAIKNTLTALKDCVTDFDWSALGSGIGESINNIDWRGIISELSGFISGTIEGALATIAGLAETIDWQKLGNDIWNSITSLVENFDFEGIAESGYRLLGAALAGAVNLIIGIGESFWKSLESAFENTKSYFSEYIEDAGGNVIEGLFNGIKDAVLGIGDWIIENIWNPFKEGFCNAFGIHSPSTKMEEFGGYIIEGLFNGIKGVWDTVTGFFGDKFSEIENTISTTWTNIQTGAQNAWSNITSTLSDTWSSIKNTASEKFSEIKSAVEDSGWVDVGRNICNGISTGLDTGWSWLKDKVGGIANGVIDTAKDMFGIHSPSTVFRDLIGKNLVKGISVGVDLETPNLQKDVENQLGKVTAGIESKIELENSKLAPAQSGGRSTILGGITLKIEHFYNNTKQDIRELTQEVMEVAEEYVKSNEEVFA